MGVVKPEEVRLALASPQPPQMGAKSYSTNPASAGICRLVYAPSKTPSTHQRVTPSRLTGVVLYLTYHSILCQLPSPMGVACTFGVSVRVSSANFGATLTVLLDPSSWICITPAVSG